MRISATRKAQGVFVFAREADIPVVVTLRGFEAEYLQRKGVGDQIRSMLKQVDGCICVGDFLRDLAIKKRCEPGDDGYDSQCDGQQPVFLLDPGRRHDAYCLCRRTLP